VGAAISSVGAGVVRGAVGICASFGDVLGEAAGLTDGFGSTRDDAGFGCGFCAAGGGGVAADTGADVAFCAGAGDVFFACACAATAAAAAIFAASAADAGPGVSAVAGCFG